MYIYAFIQFLGICYIDFIQTYLRSKTSLVPIAFPRHPRVKYVEEHEEFLIHLILYYCRYHGFYNSRIY